MKYIPTMKSLLALPVALLLGTAACSSGGGGSDSADRPVSAYEAWRASLTDSVDSLQHLYDTYTVQTDSLFTRLSEVASGFEAVTDPVLVEKYRVCKGWRGHDTWSPGIFARVLEDNTVEVVATAKGDFSAITLSADGQSVTSQSVPRGDLHATIAGLTRVAFNRASDLVQFVAEHTASPITLRYGSGSSLTLTEGQKQMLAATWALHSTQGKLNNLERQQSIVYNKLEMFRTEVSADSTKVKSGK